ncbi:WD repeat-containing protein 47-like [Anabrus simplex]|uniref:WD repeat-containing protein 47-like n=1 Tax=Anabrus simplex TaxID=316456 RepID=UPI0035A305F5
MEPDFQLEAHVNLNVGLYYERKWLRIRYVMPSAHLTLREEDVVRLTLEFLHTRELHISQLSLERETGVINGAYSDDVLFLRQLILDGQWDDVLEFIQPLEALPTFDMRRFRYIILRHKYVELVCIKSEAGPVNNMDSAVEDVVKVLNELERVAPSKEEYSNLCLMLTLPRLSDHLQYKNWNPSNARVQCFREVFPLVEQFLPGEKKSADQATNCGSVSVTAKNDRLIHLIIKGILYESCVNYCQAKATGTKESQQQEMTFSRLLDGSVGYSDSDLSLLSWLQSIPPETFSVPFEQRTLNVDIERLERPSLETSWTEHMLVTPIKPKLFPHSAMPFTRPRSAADIMSRSLLPALDGLPFGLADQQGGGHTGSHNRNQSPMMMALSTGDINMSRSSFASFHLTGYKNNKLMNTSVDRLFENDDDVFLSSNYNDFQQLPSIQENLHMSTPKPNPPPRVRGRSRSPDKKSVVGGGLSSAASTPEHRGRESPATVSSTARSSRRDSLCEKPSAVTVLLTGAENHTPHLQLPTAGFDGDLLKEYQRQKQRLQETLQVKEREREELVRQLACADNRQQENSAEESSPANSEAGTSATVSSKDSTPPDMNSLKAGGKLPPPPAGSATVTVRTTPPSRVTMPGPPMTQMNGSGDAVR